MLLKNAVYLDRDGTFKEGDILVRDGLIKSIGKGIEGDDEQIDLNGKRVIPGLIDVHFHGAVGYDVMDATPEQILEIADFLAKEGTTSFLPTTITAGIEDIESALANIREAASRQRSGSSIEGVHIEGPYLNELYKGCHDTTKMKRADIAEYEKFRAIAGDLKFHVTLAPEIEGSLDFIRYVRGKNDTVAIGHTNANYDEVCNALLAGAAGFTHLFNGMRGIHHREPGTAGTALLSDAYVELICDGVHVDRHMVDMVYRLKGKDRIVLVTDAMLATGLGDGEYMFGGSKVIVKNGIARNEDGGLASSTLTLYRAVRNMTEFTAATFEEAVQMASINPARFIGIDHITGSIEEGKRADLVILNGDDTIDCVYVKGIRA